MNSDRKFTIIIPTRDRGDTLVHAITSAIAQDYDNLEILVSDNASTDDTADLMSLFNDARIRYINTGKRVSMSHNWEFALEHVTEGWVTVLGDDDAILPGALKSVNRIIDETGTNAIRSNGCNFAWPGLLGSRHGVLTISLKKGYKRVRSKTALDRVLNGSLDYNKLPVLYNGGFIDISLVKKVKSITGRFFLSMTPDIYSAMVFSLLIDEYIYSEEPLAINGASHHSGGTAGLEKIKRKRAYDPAGKFMAENNIPFHHFLPLLDNGTPVRSIQALIYEAYLQAEPFHDLKNLTVLADKQLEVILRNSAPHRDEVNNWGESFAELHQLNYEKILKKSASNKKPAYVVVKEGVIKIEKLVSDFSINGNEYMPLSNVYEASVVAGTVKSIRPGMIKRITGIFRRVRRYLRLSGGNT